LAAAYLAEETSSADQYEAAHKIYDDRASVPESDNQQFEKIQVETGVPIVPTEGIIGVNLEHQVVPMKNDRPIYVEKPPLGPVAERVKYWSCFKEQTPRSISVKQEMTGIVADRIKNWNNVCNKNNITELEHKCLVVAPAVETLQFNSESKNTLQQENSIETLFQDETNGIIVVYLDNEDLVKPKSAIVRRKRKGTRKPMAEFKLFGTSTPPPWYTFSPEKAYRIRSDGSRMPWYNSGHWSIDEYGSEDEQDVFIKHIEYQSAMGLAWLKKFGENGIFYSNGEFIQEY
jgi:hypothetical protein